MKTLEEAIDDYFHAMVRTHPWNKKRFEAALEPMMEWFEAEFGHPAPLAALTSENVMRYLGMLEYEDRADTEEALTSLSAWLSHWGWLETDPLKLQTV